MTIIKENIEGFRIDHAQYYKIPKAGVTLEQCMDFMYAKHGDKFMRIGDATKNFVKNDGKIVFQAEHNRYFYFFVAR
jgi:hypothetical protein